MDDDYQNPLPGKTYVSPSLEAFGDKERRVRIASKILPSENGYEYAKERDEVVLRKKPDAKTYITAKFLEDTRQTFVLTVQKFVSETGQPYGTGFSFVGEEIGRFCEFLANIRCQPWRAKRRLVIPGSREAALLTRRARSAPEGKQSRHPNTASSHWEL
ncbi:MAG: DUF4263 domain-containing protein, partial [Candidatus Sedimenticola sp. (ex Thyasira tokunagai)]